MAIGNGRLGVLAISAIVLLRLAVGWHFYSEGVKKLEPGFSSAGFLRGAKGPLAPLYKQFVAGAYGFDNSVATPRKLGSMTPEQAEENAKWRGTYTRELKIAEREKRTIPLQLPPNSSYSEWGESILESWEATRDSVSKPLASALGQDAETTAAEIDALYVDKRNQLVRYLATQESNIDEYRHELWRLANLKTQPERDAPFQKDRITEKLAEVSGTPRGWLASVESLDEDYREALLNYSQNRLDEKPQVAGSIQETLFPRSSLSMIDMVVTSVVISVGACLILGFLTPLAAVVGALFLLSVMATQPPWIEGANTDYFLYQFVEVFAFGVLGAVGAGRWYGLDGLFCYFWNGCCGKPAASNKTSPAATT